MTDTELDNEEEEVKIGQIQIETDNYSALTIMKDQISAQASQRNI